MITIPPKPEKPENPIQQIAVNAREAAKLLGISHGTLRLWTRQGLIPHRKIGGRLLYSVESLKAFVVGEEKRVNDFNDYSDNPA